MRKIGILLCCMLATSAHASGLMNQNYSASTLGVSNAVLAASNDVAAAAYNPAGIAWQDGFQIMAGMDTHYRNSSVVQAAGTTSNNTTNRVLNYLYASWMPHDQSWGVSMAYNTPFNVDNDWSSAFPTTSAATSIQSERLSVDGIYALNSSLAFSVGADWYKTSAQLSQGTNSFSGENNASFTGHASMKWKLAPQWMLAASVRQGSKIVLTGNGNTSSTLNLPDEFAVGIAHDYEDALRIALDINWTAWSSMKNLNVTTGNTITQTNTLNMKDSLRVKTGATWFWRENAQMRFGYAYDQGANNSTGFHPMLADQPSHQLSVGVGGDMMDVHFDLAYAYTYYAKQTVTGAFAGTYRDRQQSLIWSLSKGF